LKGNQILSFFLYENVLAAYVLCSLRLLKLKAEDKQYRQKTSPKSYKKEIKIIVNPGLA